MENLRVKCPGCKGIFHKTTKWEEVESHWQGVKYHGRYFRGFNPYITANGSMVFLIEPYRSRGWTSFGQEDGRPPHIAERKETYAPMMTCPNCSHPLAASGKLTIVNADGKEWDPPNEDFYRPWLRFESPVKLYTDEELEIEWNERLKEKIGLHDAETAVLETDQPSKDQTRQLRDVEILRLREEGMSYSQIAAEMNISKTTVSEVVKNNEV